MALVRFQFPDQEPRQCRLAGAVRTDYADAVAPLHAKGEILQDRAVAEALRYILRIDDDLGLALAAFGRQPGDAGRALHGTANLAHFLQLAEPPLVAPAPRGRSEEHTSELQSLMRISYAVFCLKKKKNQHRTVASSRQPISTT